jgi:hypothetical protein
MDRLAYIYKITNPKGYVYIGSTIDLNGRKSKYKNLRCVSQTKLYNSLKKYGFDKHTFEVIFTCNEIDRNKYEFLYGKEFNVISDNGLNLSLPKIDDSYVNMSNETKLKIGLKHKNKIISDSQKKLLSIKNKEFWLNNEHPRKNKPSWNKGKSFLKGELNPMYGVKRSEEWKINQRKLMKSIAITGENHKSSKTVVNLDNGVFNYSIKEAAEMYNYNYSTLKNMLNSNSINKTNLILMKDEN